MMSLRIVVNDKRITYDGISHHGEMQMDRPVTKAELEDALDRQLKELTRRFYLIGGLAAALFAVVLEVMR